MLEKLHEKNKLFITSILIILGIMFTLYIIWPSFIGYSTYKKVKSSNFSLEDYGKNIQELKLKFLVSQTNLTSCTAFNEKLLIGLDRYSDKFSSCNSDLRFLEMNFNFTENRYEELIKDLKADLKEKNRELNKLIFEKQEEINGLESQHNLVIQNVANNLCCKAKVDNPDINYYIIENNKILCMEEGTTSISCFSSSNLFPLSR